MTALTLSDLVTRKPLEAFCRKFNLAFTVGDYVILRDALGHDIETMLDSTARIEGGHPVADFRGQEWPCRIDGGRVRHVSSGKAG